MTCNVEARPRGLQVDLAPLPEGLAAGARFMWLGLGVFFDSECRDDMTGKGGHPALLLHLAMERLGSLESEVAN